MNALEAIVERAKQQPQRIVLSEGEDVRIAEGAVRAQREGIASPILVGSTSLVQERLRAVGADPDEFDIVDPATTDKLASYAAVYHTLRRHKGVDEQAALEAMANPLMLAAMMVREGDADGTIGGAVATTADTVRAAFQIIGRAKDISTVSSFFLMMLDQPHHPRQGVVMFADCALIVEPTADELTQIAVSSASSLQALTPETPRIAMLSFSTAGSARHERVSRVAEATKVVKSLRPDLPVDGEIQFDAAFVPEVGKAKAPDSPLAGDANVLVFPGLEAGNIGYKIAQRIGRARAIGPVLQGLSRPANDLSRGCNVDDVYNLIAVTGVQAAADPA